MQDDRVYSKRWHSQDSLFKHFQGYLGIFRDIDAYLNILTGVQLGRREEASPASPKLKTVSCFGRKNTVYVYQWVKFSIQKVLLRECRRKNSKMFPCMASFSFFLILDEIIVEVP